MYCKLLTRPAGYTMVQIYFAVNVADRRGGWIDKSISRGVPHSRDVPSRQRALQEVTYGETSPPHPPPHPLNPLSAPRSEKANLRQI